jgi:hypothetical protein
MAVKFRPMPRVVVIMGPMVPAVLMIMHVGGGAMRVLVEMLM